MIGDSHLNIPTLRRPDRVGRVLCRLMEKNQLDPLLQNLYSPERIPSDETNISHNSHLKGNKAVISVLRKVILSKLQRVVVREMYRSPKKHTNPRIGGQARLVIKQEYSQPITWRKSR
jgi:hypothetical protein